MSTLSPSVKQAGLTVPSTMALNLATLSILASRASLVSFCLFPDLGSSQKLGGERGSSPQSAKKA
jgi:hypothetical protein